MLAAKLLHPRGDARASNVHEGPRWPRRVGPPEFSQTLIYTRLYSESSISIKLWRIQTVRECPVHH